MVDLTKEQIKLFKDEFDKWVKHFGIHNEWSVYFTTEEIDAFAQIHMNADNRIATLKLNPVFENYCIDDIEQHLKNSAKHEAIHLLLGEVDCAGIVRFMDEKTHYSLYEKLVIKLESLL
jgi:hypothetical protein